MSTRTQSSTGRRHNERVTRWNNIVRNLASRNAGRMMLMDLEYELRALNQARFTSDGRYFNSIEGQGWMNRVFQERKDELEVDFLDRGTLRTEEATNVPAISTFVPSNQETRLGSVTVVPQVLQSTSEREQRSDVSDRLGEAPVRRTLHPRRRLGLVNQAVETTSGTSRSERTTSTSRQERRPDRSSLMWSRPIPSPWHVYKQDLIKLNLQTVRFAADAMRTLKGAKVSVNGLYSIVGVDLLIAAGNDFSSTTALLFADLEGLPLTNTMSHVNARPLKDVRMNHSKQNRVERPGCFLTIRAPTGQHVKMFKQVRAPPAHVKD